MAFNLFGTYSDKQIKKMKPTVDKILSLEGKYREMSDAELKACTPAFKERLNKGETLDDILPEAFAVCREASTRVLGMTHYPVQLMGGITLHNGDIAEMQTGEGKANPVDTPLPTPDGWKVVGDIKVGDMLFDRLGNPTKVLAVYPQGKIDTYEIELTDGRTVKCAAEHLWNVYTGYNRKNTKTMMTIDMYEKGALAKRGYNFALPTASAVQYDEVEFKISPYAMGCMLGDGCKNQNGNFVMSSSDEEMVDRVAKEIGATRYQKNKCTYDWYFYPSEEKNRLCVRDVDEKYEELLTDTYCYEKYIPMEYKIASIEQRMELIRGLMDTDGNIDGSNENGIIRYNLSFSTSSERLKNDFMEIIYSLGYSCSSHLHRKAGVRNAKHDQYVVRINVPNEVKPEFFNLKRKKDIAIKASAIKKKRDYDRVSIKDIRKLEEQTEQVCFVVDNEEHLFLIGQYVVTHNTLVGTLPAYLNGLTGKGVHVVTVNDYLAKRDSEWNGKLFRWLGLSVGLIYSGQDNDEKKKAYECDITYGTNNEFGFDYLRDNMARSKTQQVQRGHAYAIIDEVDSILIDEARTPLIISGKGRDASQLYSTVDAFVRTLKCTKVVEVETKASIESQSDGDYILDEKHRTTSLTQKGIEKAEKYFRIDNLMDLENVELLHHIQQSIKAHGAMKRDIDYLVQDGKVLIVDEFTGRVMHGRRFNGGLHQAIEAKEKVQIASESKTMATVTFQNLFRMYDKMSGMTGTAMTEEEEFREIYGLRIVTIPTNKPNQRIDNNDQVYMSTDAKLNAIVDKIMECHEKNQPVLVGTTSVEKSEILAKRLKARTRNFNVLNAKNHEKEADIVAEAGRAGAITIATNMAGRGTDIMLGGNPDHMAKTWLKKNQFCEELLSPGNPKDADKHMVEELLAQADAHGDVDDENIIKTREKFVEMRDKFKAETAQEAEDVRNNGGLFVIGTERHESRRIDNQLRGRSARQGDPGETLFFLSLEDDLLRLFGGEMVQNVVRNSGMTGNEVLHLSILTKQIEKAQKKLEGFHFEQRKNVLKYDDVMNMQRNEMYAARQKVLDGESVETEVMDFYGDVIEDMIEKYTDNNIADWNRHGLNATFCPWLCTEEELATDDKNAIITTVKEKGKALIEEKRSIIGNDNMQDLFRFCLLRAVDMHWTEHINNMDQLKQGIHLRGYGQKDPVVAYRNEGYELYDDMNEKIQETCIDALLRIKVEMKPSPMTITNTPTLPRKNSVTKKKRR